MKLTITGKKGADIPKEFVGLFIEDINYAVDGGLYAELLENRNFESLEAFGGENKKDYYVRHDGLYAWKVCPENVPVQLSVVQGSPVSMNSPHYLRVESGQEKCGFSNKAYDGIYLRPGVRYTVSFYARSVKYQGKITVAIIKDGNAVCEKSVAVEMADAFGWNKWVPYTLELSVEKEVQNAAFAVLLENQGTVEFDHFSMMPEDAVCGIFRKDLAECLKDLQPGFLRFPGGCVVEGSTLANRYRFKDTLGDKEERRYNWNRWATHGNSAENSFHSRYAHYGQTYGIGFYEYFLLCEYLGAKPLPVLGVGLACQYQSHEKVDLESPEIYEYIQEYLDLIEFANGKTDTKWGSVRAKMGHEAPFGLEMVGVGNEQWEDEESRFFERYQLFEREIHKVYPEIRLIGTAGPELDSPRFQAAWDFYHAHEDRENFAYAVDEHYYIKPEWCFAHTDYFDKGSRGTKVFFGEYAAHSTDPVKPIPEKDTERNTLEAALAEAAFMTGMARNSDVVVMTCYAPLLARVGYTQWNPDLIWFDDKKVCRTPSYFVQQMFAKNPGDYNLAMEIDAQSGEMPCQVSYDGSAKELIVKLVNASSKAKNVVLAFDNRWEKSDQNARVIQLTGRQLSDINTLGNELVQPEESVVSLENNHYQAPPYSFSVLRIPAEVKA
ncbi:MAG: carbohydrate binding domain-containing protein [Lachnospiraceae bacterium]|nr:carbohydrate binding domain-containing protein [Lachnospiraceae bacterium]